MCLFTLLRPSARRGNAIIRIYIYIYIYICILLHFHDFPKTENARSRGMRIVALTGPQIVPRMVPFAWNAHYFRWINVSFYTFASLRAARKWNNTYIYIYICILLIFCDFPKTENARSRGMENGVPRGPRFGGCVAMDLLPRGPTGRDWKFSTKIFEPKIFRKFSWKFLKG